VEVVGALRAAYVVAGAGGADHVRVVGRDHRLPLGLAAVGYDEGDVAVLERREVGDERVEGVGALDQHEAARRAPRAGPLRHPVGELGVAEHRTVGHDRGRVAEACVVEHGHRPAAPEQGGLRGGDRHADPAGR
jgi:hypothetical protein